MSRRLRVLRGRWQLSAAPSPPCLSTSPTPNSPLPPRHAQGIERTPSAHKGPLLTALERRGIPARVLRRLQEERAQEVQARLERAAEFGRLERGQAQARASILLLPTDIAAARRERNSTAEAKRQGPQRHKEAADKRTPLERWRDEARQARERDKEKGKKRVPTHDRSKDRAGPDYER